MSADANRRIAALAADRKVHKAFAWLHLHEPQIRRWQLDLTAIPAPTFHESARAAWFLSRFHLLGLANPHIDEAGNALAELPSAQPAQSANDKLPHQTANALLGRGFSPTIPGSQKEGALAPEGAVLLSAHLDTVFPTGTDCTPQEAEDGSIHAPGITDNGAGLAALLAIAAALQHAGLTPPAPLLFAANTGEEGEGDLHGMRHLFGPSPWAPRIRSAIALEGSGNATIDRALGSRRLRVTVTGPGGHSWADSNRPNAILALADCLLALERLKLPSTPRTTLNAGLMQGGNSVNSIPATATAVLDLRSASSHELDRLELAVLRTLTASITQRNATLASPLHLTAERIGDRPAGALDLHSWLAHSLRAVDRHLQIATDSRLGSTDANLPLACGIPALAIGAGGAGGGIHTLSEWHNPHGRDLALRRILLLVLDACTQVAESH